MKRIGIVIGSAFLVCVGCSKKPEVETNPTPVQPAASAQAAPSTAPSAPAPAATGPTNLAEGKTWTTSSKLVDCDTVAGTCGNVKTKIFFHTKEEKDPWIQYDLETPTAFSSVVVTNRQDSYFQRALPLVLETSDDGKKFQEIARQKTLFTVWKPEFPPQTARYVRLRVDNDKTMLHLEGVEIRP